MTLTTLKVTKGGQRGRGGRGKGGGWQPSDPPPGGTIRGKTLTPPDPTEWGSVDIYIYIHIYIYIYM